MVKIMTIESEINITERSGFAEITAVFSSGAVLERRGDIWTYDFDGRSSAARDPEHAVRAAEGISRGKTIFNSNNSEANEA